MRKLDHYKYIAELFRYPDDNFAANAVGFAKNIAPDFPFVSEKLDDFVGKVENLNTKELKEYYSKTFDVQAICFLDIGYMMFGEDYKRAQLLVNLQKEHKIAGVDCGTELSDHLPNVLCLLAQTKNNDFAEELGFIIVTSSVRFMLTKFKNENNYYKILLEVLLDMLQHDFAGNGLSEFAFSEESFSEKNEFLMPSPKISICNSVCNQKRF
jgi:nitrate reductase assembly molybdenum cofactor insertion protein NarJ